MNFFKSLALILIAIGFFHSKGLGQNSTDSLEFWSDVMFNAKYAKHRILAAPIVKRILISQVQNNQLDTTRLNADIVRIRIPNSRIELFTWQVEGNSEFDYHGFIKYEDGSIEILNREQRDILRIRREQFNYANWYGAVYYHLIPVDFNQSNYFILFGFAQNSNQEKFRIIEVVSFKNGQVVFGKPIFESLDQDQEKELLYRQVIRYSNSASCALKYDEKDSTIIYDHIMNYQDPNEANRTYFYPDGTYEGFEFRNGNWKYIEKLKVEIQKSAPREKPVLNDKSKDIFGREKDSKKNK